MFINSSHLLKAAAITNMKLVALLQIMSFNSEHLIFFYLISGAEFLRRCPLVSSRQNTWEWTTTAMRTRYIFKLLHFK